MSECSEERLFGEPGAEWMDDCIDATADRLACDGDPGPFTVEEWTVRPAIAPVPSVDGIIDWLSDWIGDSADLTPEHEAWESYDRACRTDEVRAAIQAVRELIAAKSTWREADRHVATWTATCGEDNEWMFERVEEHR